MKLRTDTIGHFDNPTEDIIRDAVAYSGEGAREGDLVKLMTDEGHYLCIWIGQRSFTNDCQTTEPSKPSYSEHHRMANYCYLTVYPRASRQALIALK